MRLVVISGTAGEHADDDQCPINMPFGLWLR